MRKMSQKIELTIYSTSIRLEKIMNLLRRLFFNLFVWFTSISIVLGSIIFVLPNGQLHKQKLSDGNFYEKLSNELKPKVSKDKLVIQNGFEYILSNTIISQLVTPTWLRGVVEKNIDTTSNWLNGGENWELYVPIRDVEQSIQKSIDTQTSNFVDTNKLEIKVCTAAQADLIKQNGFDLNKEFCIPSEVRNQQKTLTEFVSDSTLSPTTGILNKLVKGSNLSTTSEIQNIGDISQGATESKKKIISTVTLIRDWTIILRSNVAAIVLILTGLLLANIWLVYATRRKLLYFVFRASFMITLLTAIFSCGVFLFIGGSSYLTSWFKDFLLPGFVTNESIKIVTEQLAIFALDLVYPALFIGLFVFFVGGVAWVLNRFDVLVPQRYKQSPKVSNATNYKTFSITPDEPILSKNTHETKLELLKNYKPELGTLEESKSAVEMPKLPGAIKSRLKNHFQKRESPPVIIPKPVSSESTTLANPPTVRKIQL
jgi:hypothetical protein